MFNLELITYQDKLYRVHRKFMENRIKQEYIQDLKVYFDCDLVVKTKQTNNEPYLLFLREIPELEILD